MENILKKLIKIRDNLSLCTIKYVSEKDIEINIDGFAIDFKKDANGVATWQWKNSKIEPFESAFLEFIIAPYITKLIEVSNFFNYNFVNMEISLEDIQDMYSEKYLLSVI